MRLKVLDSLIVHFTCVSVNGEQKRSVIMSDKDVMLPRAAGRYIAEHSVDVKVSQDGVEKTAKKACDSMFLVLWKGYLFLARSSVTVLHIVSVLTFKSWS